MGNYDLTHCYEVRRSLSQHPAVTRLHNGDLLVLYSDLTDRMEGQTGYLIRSRDGGASWSDPELVLHGRWWHGAVHTTLGMQALRSGRVLIPFEHGGDGKRDWRAPSRFICLRSDDQGKNWRGWDEQKLGLEQFSPYGKIVEFPDGTVLCPGWHIAGGPPHSSSLLICSHDAGETWSAAGHICDEPGASETDVTLLPDGRLLAAIRMAGEELPSGRKLYWVNFSWSSDGGQSWTQPRRSKILGQNFNCWLLEDGALLGACRGIDGTGRLYLADIQSEDERYTGQCGYGIHLFRSADAGENWTFEMTLPDPSGRDYTAFHEAGEPCFCNMPNGQILIVYYSYDSGIGQTINVSALPVSVQHEFQRIPHVFNRRICAGVLRPRTNHQPGIL